MGGTPEQKARFLPDRRRQEARGTTISRPNVGSDPRGTGRPRSPTATPTLNGTKL
jgi:alkylation response protein AidB-like acyl-CoA dehydrogenase